jgi:hypothetical protein
VPILCMPAILMTRSPMPQRAETRAELPARSALDCYEATREAAMAAFARSWLGKKQT